MTESHSDRLQTLYEGLLKLADKEKRALTADNLGELEACMRRKEEMIENLLEVENQRRQDGAADHNEEVDRLLEQVTKAHEFVRDDIKKMLDECQQAMLEIRIDQRARRAYHRAGRKGRERSTQVL